MTVYLCITICFASECYGVYAVVTQQLCLLVMLCLLQCESIATILSRATALLWLFIKCGPRMLALTC